MKCDEVRQHWHLFHDSEGDAKLHFQINEHLEMCPECARWFSAQSRLEDGITRKFQATIVPTATLWDGIERQLTPAGPRKNRNWLLFGSAVIALAACVLIAVTLGPWPRPGRSNTPGLAQLSVALHDSLVTGREDVKFTSDSPIEVENYLRTQVTFPVRCPPREDAGFEVRGGGTCKLANDPVAYVVGHVDGEDVSLFILSRDSLPNFPGEHALLREQVVHQRRMKNTDVVMKEIDRNLVLIVGRAETRRLERVLKAYGTYGHGDAEHSRTSAVHDQRS